MASHFARRLGAVLLVEHVLERDTREAAPVYTPTDPDTAGHLIDLVLARLETEGIPAEGEVTIALSGFKAQAILSAAVDSGADLIMIEASRLSPFLALVGLSPVHRIVRSCHCPVLLVPAVPRPSLALRLRSGFRRIWTR